MQKRKYSDEYRREAVALTQQVVLTSARGVPGLSMGYMVHVDCGDGSWFVPTDVPFSTPWGTLASAIDVLISEIVVASGPDTDRVASVSGPDFSREAGVAWIEHDGVEEFIAFRDVGRGSGNGRKLASE